MTAARPAHGDPPSSGPSDNFHLKRIGTQDVAHHEEVMELIRDSFYPPESVRKIPVVSQVALAGLLDARVPGILQQGMSVAVLDDPGRVLGVSINDLVSPNNEELHHPTVQPSVKSILSCIRQLQKSSSLKDQRGMSIFYLAVRDRFSGRGLGRRLVQQSMDLARERQLGFLQSFSIGPDGASSRLFDELGFVGLEGVKLAGQRQADGSPAFPHAGPDDILRLVVKTL